MMSTTVKGPLMISGQFVTDGDVLPPPGVGAAPLFGLVLLLDLGELLGSPVLALDVLELAGLLGAVAFGVDVGLVPGGDRVAVGVDVEVAEGPP